MAHAAPWLRHADIAVAGLLAVLAAAAAFTLPAGSPLRLAASAPLLVVPGYLALQAAMPRSTARNRGWHAAMGAGLSPAVLGATALLLALVPGAFRLERIVLVTTGASLLLAAVALRRRLAKPKPGPRGERTSSGLGGGGHGRPARPDARITRETLRSRPVAAPPSAGLAGPARSGLPGAATEGARPGASGTMAARAPVREMGTMRFERI